jgi:5'(3')-deoxyribonucleotidase
MVLAIDIDGVLRDFVGSLCRQYHRDFPSHQIKPVTRFGLHEFFPIGPAICDYMYRVRNTEIFRFAEPYPGAVEFLDLLMADGQHVALVTSQPAGTELSTMLWLSENRMIYSSLHFANKKEIVRADILLDDGVVNLESAGRKVRAVCFDRPWNKGWRGERVHHYGDFIGLIHKRG